MRLPEGSEIETQVTNEAYLLERYLSYGGFGTAFLARRFAEAGVLVTLCASSSRLTLTVGTERLTTGVFSAGDRTSYGRTMPSRRVS